MHSGHLAQGANAGVQVVERSGLQLATVLARKGKREALIARIHDRFGIELPQAPLRIASGCLAFAGTAPDAWLATDDSGNTDLPALLAEAVGDLASLAEQSDGLTVLRMTGPNVRDTLCKLVPIDLHPRVFPVGSVAVTLAAHMPVTLYRLPDANDRSPTFEIATFRSFAASFWHALSESAASPHLASAGPRSTIL